MAIVGAVEAFDGTHLVGWARDTDRPGEVLRVEALIKGEVVAEGLAAEFRSDVPVGTAAGDWLGFRLTIQSRLPITDGSWPAVRVHGQPDLLPSRASDGPTRPEPVIGADIASSLFRTRAQVGWTTDSPVPGPLPEPEPAPTVPADLARMLFAALGSEGPTSLARRAIRLVSSVLSIAERNAGPTGASFDLRCVLLSEAQKLGLEDLVEELRIDLLAEPPDTEPNRLVVLGDMSRFAAGDQLESYLGQVHDDGTAIRAWHDGRVFAAKAEGGSALEAFRRSLDLGLTGDKALLAVDALTDADLVAEAEILLSEILARGADHADQ